ncbi:MAG: single-stranded DNA-binding protein [Actinobacteria bacterium]|nr:single-stranded DNA-binding protein [Actinomycetota bacterium]
MPTSRAADLIDSPLNAVELRGVLAATRLLRTLPSGDELITFRLTVPRPTVGQRVDSIDCVTGRTMPRRCLLRCAPGDVLKVSGQLCRRFWRGTGGLNSRYEVDAATVRVVTRTRRRSA